MIKYFECQGGFRFLFFDLPGTWWGSMNLLWSCNCQDWFSFWFHFSGGPRSRLQRWLWWRSCKRFPLETLGLCHWNNRPGLTLKGQWGRRRLCCYYLFQLCRIEDRVFCLLMLRRASVLRILPGFKCWWVGIFSCKLPVWGGMRLRTGCCSLLCSHINAYWFW